MKMSIYSVWFAKEVFVRAHNLENAIKNASKKLGFDIKKYNPKVVQVDTKGETKESIKELLEDE